METTVQISLTTNDCPLDKKSGLCLGPKKLLLGRNQSHMVIKAMAGFTDTHGCN